MQKNLKPAGSVVSGDLYVMARAIAEELGITTRGAVSGAIRQPEPLKNTRNTVSRKSTPQPPQESKS